MGRDVIERRRLRSRVGRNGTGGERGSEAEGGRHSQSLSVTPHSNPSSRREFLTRCTHRQTQHIKGDRYRYIPSCDTSYSVSCELKTKKIRTIFCQVFFPVHI